MRLTSLICIKTLLIFLLLIYYPVKAYPDDNAGLRHEGVSVTLEQAIELALQANRNIAISGYGVENQQLSLTAAGNEFDYKIIPSVMAGIDTEGTGTGTGMGVTVSKKYEYGTRISAGSSLDKRGGSYQTGVNLLIDQPLLRGVGKEVNMDSIRNAEFNLRSAKRAEYRNRVNIAMDTVVSFYEIVRQREMSSVYESSVTRLKGYTGVAKAKEKVGLATPMDSFRSEIRLKDAEDLLTQAIEALQEAKDRLKVILSLSLETPLEVIDTEGDKPVLPEIKTAIEMALKNRVELKQAEEDIREAQRRTDIAKQSILPQLNTIVEYKRANGADGTIQNNEVVHDNFMVRLQSTTDIFRSSEKAVYRQRINEIQTAILRYEVQKDEVKRQVRRQLTAVKELEKRILIRMEQMKQAEGKLVLADLKFAHDIGDNFDLIEAETELQRARVNLIWAKMDYAIAGFNMRVVTGTFIE